MSSSDSKPALQFTEGNLKILLAVVKHADLSALKIDFEEVAKEGWANAASANTRWNELKKKLMEAAGTDAGPKTPRKRKAANNDEGKASSNKKAKAGGKKVEKASQSDEDKIIKGGVKSEDTDDEA